MSYIISEIENNAIINLRVSHEDEELIEDDIREFIDALAGNTTIRSIHFEGEFLGCLRGSDRSELIQTIGNIPTLREVHMNRGLVMVKDVSTLISRATQLRVLRMNHIVFQGVESEHEACERALYQHTCLREFELYQCWAAAVKNVSLDKLEKAGQKFKHENHSCMEISEAPSSLVGSEDSSMSFQVGALVV